MAATKAGIGYGMKLLRESETPGTYEDMGLEVRSITPPARNRDTPDATHSASPDGYEEVVPGIKRTGPATVEIQWVPGSPGYAQLGADFEAGEPVNYQIETPAAGGAAGMTCTFAGIVIGLSEALPRDDVMTATVTMKVVGKPVWEDISS